MFPAKTQLLQHPPNDHTHLYSPGFVDVDDSGEHTTYVGASAYHEQEDDQQALEVENGRLQEERAPSESTFT